MKDFNGIFSKYFLNITVLCGKIAYKKESNIEKKISNFDENRGERGKMGPLGNYAENILKMLNSKNSKKTHGWTIVKCLFAIITDLEKTGAK